MCSQRGILHIAWKEVSYEPCRFLVGWELQVGKAKATNKLERHLIASETSYYSKKGMSMHHIHSVLHLPRDCRASPRGGHSPLAAPLVCLSMGFVHDVILVVVVF